jgi:hypothetical protein
MVGLFLDRIPSFHVDFFTLYPSWPGHTNPPRAAKKQKKRKILKALSWLVDPDTLIFFLSRFSAGLDLR